MESKAKRTLVKSPPELWELAEDPARMEAWIAGLTGAPPGGLEVTTRDRERALGWRAAGRPGTGGDRDRARAIGIRDSVRITAEHDLADPQAALAALEGMLDELGSRSGAPSLAADPGRAAVVAALGAALIDALDAHLPGAREHAEATAAYAFAIAAELAWSRERAELVREAAKLHDAGMVYVPAATLRKPEAERDEDERALLASHIEAGAGLARGAGLPDDVCGWILATRERWDGGGPEGLRGAAIPEEGRLIRVACADRPAAALERPRAGAGGAAGRVGLGAGPARRRRRRRGARARVAIGASRA